MERIESSLQEAKSAFWNTTRLLGTLADETELGANYNVFSRSDLGVGWRHHGARALVQELWLLFSTSTLEISVSDSHFGGSSPTCNRVEERIHVFNSEVLDCQLIIDGKWN